MQLQRQLHQLPARCLGLLARQPRPQPGQERRQRLHRAGAPVQPRELEERVDVVKSRVRVRGQMAAGGLGVTCADRALRRQALQPLALGGRMTAGLARASDSAASRSSSARRGSRATSSSARRMRARTSAGFEPQRVLEEASLPRLAPRELCAAEEQTGRGQRVGDQRRLPREQRRGLRAVAGGELELGQRLEDLPREEATGRDLQRRIELPVRGVALPRVQQRPRALEEQRSAASVRPSARSASAQRPDLGELLARPSFSYSPSSRAASASSPRR